MLIQRKTRLSIVIMIASSIFGCGGDSAPDNTPAPTPPPVSDTFYYAQDAIRHSSPSEQFYVDLSNNMESSDGSLVSLTRVTSLIADDTCDVVAQDSKGFTIRANSAKVCDYRYRVGAASMSRSDDTQGDVYAEATVRMAIGALTESLIPLSTITSSSTSITIDIVDLLGLNSYILDTDTYILSESVVLPNQSSTSSTAIADVANNTIEYTPGSEIPSGVERILYSYSDGTDVLTGTIDVAISTGANNAPVAASTLLTVYQHPETGEVVSKIPYGLATAIDVSDLIEDEDGDTLHLIDVFSYDATLVIPEDANKDGNDFNDTVFEFTRKNSGLTNVTYVVSDGKGGYATGVLQLIVSSVYSVIHVNDSTPTLLFIPPLTAGVAESASIKFTAVTGDGVTSLQNIDTASHDWITANGYCEAAGGSLPTKEQLSRLYTFVGNRGGLFDNYTWPQNLAYWSLSEGTSTAGNKQAFNVGTGLVLEDEPQEQSYYVACLTEEGPVSVTVVGDSKIKLNVSPAVPEPTAPDIQYHYQLESTSTKETKTIDDSLVTWRADNNLPHYATLSSDGIITIAQSKVISTDKDTFFSITGCYEVECDDIEISVAFGWNDILTDGIYEFSPLMTAEEANAISVNVGVTDTANDSYKKRGSSLLKKEWQEVPQYQAQNYCDRLAGVDYAGGRWKVIDSTDIANIYVGLVAEKMNAVGDEGALAGNMLAAFNLQRSDTAWIGYDILRKQQDGKSYLGSFVGEVPNITAKVHLSGLLQSSFIGSKEHTSHAVCYRNVQ
ncbi:hypothetical protein BTO01_25885 [Vibrio jasicida]|nr:hypothetical protein BTO01_25885 [Vibrio jasicida]